MNIEWKYTWECPTESVETLRGLIFRKVEVVGDSVVFLTTTTAYKLEHMQDCCEEVWLAEVIGDVKDLEGVEILQAEVVTQQGPKPQDREVCYDTGTWSFYKLATIKGYVTFRFFGCSNGYYSEKVDVIKGKIIGE